MKSSIKDIKREIRSELQAIASEYKIGGWNYQKIERMSPDEAFNRGYYRALYGILQALKSL